MVPTPAEILAAADRLRGQVVATPLIGGLVFPGMEHVRIKPEILQPGGSIWYRGYLHWMLRQMGARKGIVVDAALGARPAFAAAVAARSLRVEFVVAFGAQLRTPDVGAEMVEDPKGRSAQLRTQRLDEHAQLRTWLVASGMQQSISELSATDAGRRSGFRMLPAPGDADVQAGIATVGLELAQQAPAEVDRVAASPALLEAAVELGLRVAGRPMGRIALAPAGQASEPEWLGSIRETLRLQLSVESCRVLVRSCAQSKPVGVVIGE